MFAVGESALLLPFGSIAARFLRTELASCQVCLSGSAHSEARFEPIQHIII